MPGKRLLTNTIQTISDVIVWAWLLELESDVFSLASEPLQGDRPNFSTFGTNSDGEITRAETQAYGAAEFANDVFKI